MAARKVSMLGPKLGTRAAKMVPEAAQRLLVEVSGPLVGPGGVEMRPRGSSRSILVPAGIPYGTHLGAKGAHFP